MVERKEFVGRKCLEREVLELKVGGVGGLNVLWSILGKYSGSNMTLVFNTCESTMRLRLEKMD